MFSSKQYYFNYNIMKRSEIKLKTHRNCKNCGNEFKLFRTTDKYCSNDCRIESEGHKEKKVYKAPNKISDKRKIENLKYSVLRIEFLSKKENKICPITKQPTTEIHHKCGRVGYADDVARQNNISLLIDIRYFLAVSRKGHQWIEENPLQAKEMGYSIDRLTLKSIIP